MMKIRTLISFALLMLPVGLSAQVKDYAYGHSIDMQFGYTFSPSKVGGDAGTAMAFRDGASFDIRYSYFFGRHFGLFGQFTLAGASADDIHYFGALYQADGNKFKYEPYSEAYDKVLMPILSIGPAMRFDAGGWSVRPRLGIGAGSYLFQNMSYAKYNFSAVGTAPVFIDKSLANKQVEYLVDDTYEDNIHLVLSPSVQVKASVGYHFFFSFEVGAHILPSTLTYNVETYPGKSDYDPVTWVDAIYQSYNIDSYSKDYEHCIKTTESFIPAPLFYCSFGIGWEIGWNRNARRY